MDHLSVSTAYSSYNVVMRWVSVSCFFQWKNSSVLDYLVSDISYIQLIN